ncbi:ArnT family glycosyltransferase [Coprobacter sp.]
MKLDSKSTLGILLVTISILTLIPFIGLTDFHTKGEPREAIVAVSMLNSGNWILPENNGGDIAYKPPMFHWSVAAVSSVMDKVTEFSSRFPSALSAIIIALFTFLFYAKRSNNNRAFLTALLFLSTFEIHRAAMAARVDMVLTVFIVLALFQLYQWTEKGLKGIPLVATIFMGAATLTKGPVGIILPCTVTALYLLLRKENFWKIIYKFFITGVISCILPAIWYYLAYKQGGDNFINLVMEENFGRFLGKMSYESHEQSIFYYIYITAAGFIPWSILVLLSLFFLHYHRINTPIKEWWRKLKNTIESTDPVKLFTFLSFAVIFIFYCIPKSKRSVYLLPIYPFLAFFLAEYMFYLLKNYQKVWRIFGMFLSGLTGLILIVFISVKSGWISPQLIGTEKLSDNVIYYLNAFHTPWNLFSTGCVIALIIVLYQVYKNKRELSLNNRYLYSVVALFFWLQILLDATILPTILNAKSMRPFAHKVEQIIPEGKIYSYVGAPMMRFFIINFYNDNRVVDFEKELPDTGYLLVGEKDFTYISGTYSNKYQFTDILKSDRKGNDVKDIIHIYQFEKIE